MSRWKRAIKRVVKDLKWAKWKDAIEFEKNVEWPDNRWRDRIPIGYASLPRGAMSKDYTRIRGLYYKRKYRVNQGFVPRDQYIPVDVGVYRNRSKWYDPKVQRWLKRSKGDTAVYEDGEFVGYE